MSHPQKNDPPTEGRGRDASKLVRHYERDGATGYEALRRDSPKWQFEQDALVRILRRQAGSSRSIIDAPVGTGRFLDVYADVLDDVAVLGLDASSDMLTIAGARTARGAVTFRQQDIVNAPIGASADVIVCFRFLNLVPWPDAARTLQSMFSAARNVLALAIRLVGDDYEGPMYVEDKIHLHRRSDFENLCREHSVAIASVEQSQTSLPGDYCVVECVPGKVWRSARLNKNRHAVFTYGRSAEQGKVYETKDADHAAFVRAVTADSDLASFFPQIVSSDERWIDAVWVPGELLSGDDWRRPLELLVRIQSLSSVRSSSFDYVEDLVVPRFAKAMPMVGRPVHDRVVATIREQAPAAVRVSHPDVIPGNVVCTEDAIVIIDNELLCRSKHYLVDILNMLQNLPPTTREEMLAAYLQLSNVSLGEWGACTSYLTCLWFARQVGSDLVRGDASSMRLRLRQFDTGANVLPYDSEALRAAMGG